MRPGSSWKKEIAAERSTGPGVTGRPASASKIAASMSKPVAMRIRCGMRSPPSLACDSTMRGPSAVRMISVWAGPKRCPAASSSAVTNSPMSAAVSAGSGAGKSWPVSTNRSPSVTCLAVMPTTWWTPAALSVSTLNSGPSRNSSTTTGPS